MIMAAELSIRMQSGMVDVVLTVLIAMPIFLGLSFLEPERKWDAQPREEDGNISFKPHIELHPHHYSATEEERMLEQISLLRMSYDPRHLSVVPALFSQPLRNSVGTQAYEFSLLNTNGDVVQLSQFSGRVVALMFVAMTCPPARAQIPRWDRLREQYSNDDVVFLLVYSRERHPGEPGFENFHHTRSNKEKRANAAQLASQTVLPVLVDDIDETVLDHYSGLPNPAYVIDRQGRIVFHSTWADAGKVKVVIDYLLQQGAG